MEIISRAQAKEKGLTRYFTGKECKHGHIAERHVSSRGCVVCLYEKNLARDLYHVNHSPAAKARKRRYYEKNKEKVKARVKENRRKPEYKEKFSAYAKKYWKKNAGLKRHLTAKRRYSQVERTPPWADLEAIKFFYECCPAGCHVDHIVPLNGKDVSGLHVAENLQWLPAKQNLKKSNKWK